MEVEGPVEVVEVQIGNETKQRKMANYYRYYYLIKIDVKKDGQK